MASDDRRISVSLPDRSVIAELTIRDKIHELICVKLGVSADELSLAQVLESATWKGGREIAKIKREGGGREFSSLLVIRPY